MIAESYTGDQGMVLTALFAPSSMLVDINMIREAGYFYVQSDQEEIMIFPGTYRIQVASVVEEEV